MRLGDTVILDLTCNQIPNPRAETYDQIPCVDSHTNVWMEKDLALYHMRHRLAISQPIQIPHPWCQIFHQTLG